MEGLEIAEVLYSTLNHELRYESEYHLKKYLREKSQIENHPTVALGEMAFVTDGPHGYHVVDDNSPIHMLTAKCCKNWDATTYGADRIAEVTHNSNLRSSLAVGDLILSTRGTVGLCAAVRSHCLPANIDQDVARIHLNNPSRNHSYFLCAFLNSKFGQDHIQRVASGMVQQGISLQKIREIQIPSLKGNFIESLGNLIARALKLADESQSCQKEAEQTFLVSLGLDKWNPPTPLAYEASFIEALQFGRFDAEFFQPRIKELYQLLGNKSQCIRDVSDLRQDRFNGTKNAFNYLEIGAVSTDGIIADSIIDGDEAPSRATWHVERGDVLTSTVRPIRGLTAIIEDSQHGAVASSGFAVLTPTGISPELLLCYLKLPQICELMDLHTSASMYPAISVPDILGLPFKHPGKKAEEKIVALIQQARAKRAHSKSLLERAKRAVEIAIEESEETALAYLDGKHYLADELLPKLFGPNRHYIDLATVQRTIEAEALVYEASTITRYLHEWTREGRIHDAGRGWYSDLPHAFHPNLQTPPLPELEKLLRKKFPLLEFTVWSTRQLTTFFHHYAARHATFLMVDRDAMETVADALSNAGHHVVTHPLGEAAKNFALTQDETIILRPRLSSDHKENHAPIEQMLVDLHHEIEKLGLFDLAEFQSVFENLSNRYRLNIPALKRYAERRKTDSTELLKLGGII